MDARGIELEQSLASSRLLLVGSPGSGKTTFLRHLAFLWCCGLEDTRTHSLPLPILLRIAELAAHVRSRGQNSPAGLIDFLNARNREQHWELPAEFFGDRLTAGASLLLLDGLEEAPDSARLIEQAAESWRHCRFVVTTRSSPLPPLAGFKTVEIAGGLLQSTLTCRSLS